MAALPYMQLYVAEYLADTLHLTTAQHGAYMLLLMNYWQRGKPLPNNDERLATIARMSAKEWTKNRDMIAEFFVVSDQEWTHKRVGKDLDAVKQKSEQASNAGRASGAKRGNKNATPVERPLNARSIYVERKGNHTEQNREEQNREEQNRKEESSMPSSACGEPADATLVWQLFMERTRLYGQFLMRTITDVVQGEASSGKTTEQLTGALCLSWEEYQKAIREGHLATNSAPEPFFANGLWRDKTRWKWKKGYGPFAVAGSTLLPKPMTDMELSSLALMNKSKVA